MIQYIGGQRRNTRIIRDDLTVHCKKCDTWKHITEFYTGRVYAYEDHDDFTEWFGRPLSHCRKCRRVSPKEQVTYPTPIPDEPRRVYKDPVRDAITQEQIDGMVS